MTPETLEYEIRMLDGVLSCAVGDGGITVLAGPSADADAVTANAKTLVAISGLKLGITVIGGVGMPLPSPFARLRKPAVAGAAVGIGSLLAAAVATAMTGGVAWVPVVGSSLSHTDHKPAAQAAPPAKRPTSTTTARPRTGGATVPRLQPGSTTSNPAPAILSAPPRATTATTGTETAAEPTPTTVVRARPPAPVVPLSPSLVSFVQPVAAPLPVVETPPAVVPPPDEPVPVLDIPEPVDDTITLPIIKVPPGRPAWLPPVTVPAVAHVPDAVAPAAAPTPAVTDPRLQEASKKAAEQAKKIAEWQRHQDEERARWAAAQAKKLAEWRRQLAELQAHQAQELAKKQAEIARLQADQARHIAELQAHQAEELSHRQADLAKKQAEIAKAQADQARQLADLQAHQAAELAKKQAEQAKKSAQQTQDLAQWLVAQAKKQAQLTANAPVAATAAAAHGK